MCSQIVYNRASRRDVGNDSHCSHLLFTVLVMSLTDRDRVLFTALFVDTATSGAKSVSRHFETRLTSAALSPCSYGGDTLMY